MGQYNNNNTTTTYLTYLLTYTYINSVLLSFFSFLCPGRRPEISGVPKYPPSRWLRSRNFARLKIFAFPLAPVRNFLAAWCGGWRRVAASRGVCFQIWEIPIFEIPEPEIISAHKKTPRNNFSRCSVSVRSLGKCLANSIAKQNHHSRWLRRQPAACHHPSPCNR